MEHLVTEVTFFDPPGGPGEGIGQIDHYSQAVRIDDRVEVSGQGGWLNADATSYPDALREEIVAAFDNTERVLRAAGAQWSDVVSILTYHADPTRAAIDPEALSAVADELRARGAERRPVWTSLGVSLAEGLRYEMSVVAITSPAAREAHE